MCPLPPLRNTCRLAISFQTPRDMFRLKVYKVSVTSLQNGVNVRMYNAWFHTDWASMERRS